MSAIDVLNQPLSAEASFVIDKTFGAPTGKLLRTGWASPYFMANMQQSGASSH